jgi:tetratricopeptide (TPR) repeat protein
VSAVSSTSPGPGQVETFLAAARAAAERRDWAASVSNWQAVIELSPRHLAAHLGAATALREAGRAADAEDLLAEAVPKFPQSRSVATAYAAAAHARADWAAAIDRWIIVQENFPDHPFAYLRGAQALREAGRLDDAETMLAAALRRFAGDEALAMAQAWLTNARRDWPLAVARWARLRERYPENPSVYVGSARALANAGRGDEVPPLLDRAEATLPVAIERGFDRAAADRLKIDIARLRLDRPEPANGRPEPGFGVP